MTHFRYRLFHITCLVMAGFFWIQAEDAVAVRLLSGDQLEGTLLDIGPEGVRVQPRWSPDTTQIPVANLEAVRFGNDIGPDRGCLPVEVLLTNEDRVYGNLTGLEPEIFVLEVGGSPLLRLRRDHVRALRFSPSPEDVLLDGSLQREAWKWQNGNGDDVTLPPRMDLSGRLRVPYQEVMVLGRLLPPLPERFYVEFELLPIRDPFAYNVSFFVPNLRSNAPGSVFVQLSRNMISASTLESSGRRNGTWRERIETLTLGTAARYRLFVDGSTGEMSFYLGEQQIKTWPVTDTPDKRTGPFWWGLRSQNPGALVELLGFSVHRWNGIPPPTPLQPQASWGQILLRDGRALYARLEGLDGETLRFQLQNGSVLELPRTGIWEYRTAGEALQSSRRHPSDAQVLFGDRGEVLTLHALKVDEQGLRASGGAWAETVQLPRNLLRAVYFHPYGVGALSEPGVSLDLDQPVPLLNVE